MVTYFMLDVLDYHASASSLVELGESSDVDMVAFYHLVPAPANVVLEEIVGNLQGEKNCSICTNIFTVT